MHLTALAILLLTPAAQAEEPSWRIVGGGEAVAGTWPSSGAVLQDGEFLCSAVLIAPQLVLTAGHCDSGITEVRLDAIDMDSGELISVEQTWRHPNHWTTYDVTVVKLLNAAVTPPVPVARDCVADIFVQDGAEVALVGFGAIDTWATDRPEVLHEAWTTIDDHDCDDPLRDCNESVLPGGELIAGGGGIDTCSGDSGGPLYLPTEVGTFLAGITSRAAAPNTVPCGDGGIYVRPENVIEWIEAETGLTVPPVDCTGLENSPPSPTAGTIVTVVDEPASTLVFANDADEEDDHSFAISVDGEHGAALAGPSGLVMYLPNDGYVGLDSFTVTVTDDGSPPLSAGVIVDVEVHWPPEDTGIDDTGVEPRGGGCGCSSTGGMGLALFPALLLVARRRAAGSDS